MAERVLFKELVVDGLGYCCEWGFFKLNRQTGMIAARLGVVDRTVRYHKMAFKDGCLSCEKRPNCLKGRLF